MGSFILSRIVFKPPDDLRTPTMYTLRVAASLIILPLGYLMTLPERISQETSTL